MNLRPVPGNLLGFLKNDYEVSVVPETVRVILRKPEYNGCVAQEKSPVSKANKAKCLEFVKQHVDKPQGF